MSGRKKRRTWSASEKLRIAPAAHAVFGLTADGVRWIVREGM